MNLRITPSKIFKMFSEKRSTWPDFVENEGKPNFQDKPEVDQISLTFINHATFLLQIGGINILTDPVFSCRVSPFKWVGPARVRKPGIEMEKLPKIDLIIISHNHYDHLDLQTLYKLADKHSPQVLVPLGDKDLVERCGFKDVIEMDWWEHIQIKPGLKVIFAPARHFSGRGLFDRMKSLWGSYMIQYKDKRVYFGGDSGYSFHFKEIRKLLGDPDIALIGIGAYEPEWFMKPVHMNPAEAVQAHFDIGAKQTIAMHFGTFQLSSEGIEQPLTDLKTALSEKGVSPEKFYPLNEGESKAFLNGV